MAIIVLITGRTREQVCRAMELCGGAPQKWVPILIHAGINGLIGDSDIAIPCPAGGSSLFGLAQGKGAVYHITGAMASAAPFSSLTFPPQRWGKHSITDRGVSSGLRAWKDFSFQDKAITEAIFLGRPGKDKTCY